MNNGATYFKYSVLLLILIAGIWLFRSCQCNRSGGEVISTKIDTFYLPTHDTIKVSYQTLVPYKVEYVKTKILHDTLQTVHLKWETAIAAVDTARILDQYFAKRFYAETYPIKYGEANIIDTVSQNRIIGRSVIIDQDIPVVKETVTVAEKKRVILFWGIAAIGNKDNLPYASGITLDLKLRNDAMIGAGAYLTNNKPMFGASLKFPVRLRKK